MAKIEGRALDAGLTALRGKPDPEVVAWWKERFGLIAGIPTEVARVGALLPQMRQLALLPADERRRLTKARIQAFVSLPGDQRQTIMAARKLAYGFDDELTRSDDALVAELSREVPGAGDLPSQLGR